APRLGAQHVLAAAPADVRPGVRLRRVRRRGGHAGLRRAVPLPQRAQGRADLRPADGPVVAPRRATAGRAAAPRPPGGGPEGGWCATPPATTGCAPSASP